MAKDEKNKAATLEKAAAEILAKAKSMGVENSYMFITTFQRYQEHIAHLRDLEKAIRDNEVMVTKEYVKGRANLYVNPAVTAYNQTAGAADKTAALLMKSILAAPRGGDPDDDFEDF